MKVILRQYLADLRERGELDAVLPDLLSELDFNVLSRPSRGTRQDGVDVAAVGPDVDDGNRRKLFLFTIKSGDLRRRDWDDGSPQAVRQSLNEIQDRYIRARIPQQYQKLDIAICLCIGGAMREDVHGQWTGYVAGHSTDKICFREWNGDKLAELMLSGALREELLKAHLQSYFRKAIAMADHPDVSYGFFVRLTQGLLGEDGNKRQRLTRLRQLYICLWVLYIWARSDDNLETPFRVSEYAVLQVWKECRPLGGETTMQEDERTIVLEQTLALHSRIAKELLIGKIGTYAAKPFALSRAVGSQSTVDINLSLFEQFGRLCLYGVWQHCEAFVRTEANGAAIYEQERNHALSTAIQMINSNPCLLSPIRDDFMIEIALFMILIQICESEESAVGYFKNVVQRLRFAISRRGRYPVPMANYHDLVEHPVNGSDEYFQKHTRGSVLYPLLIAWLDRLGLDVEREELVSCIKDELPHTTQQIWVPDANSEERIWSGGTDHGVAITGLPIFEEVKSYHDFLEKSVEEHAAFQDLSAIRFGLWPIVLMACRHYRLPVPLQLWFLESRSQDTGAMVVQNDE